MVHQLILRAGIGAETLVYGLTFGSSRQHFFSQTHFYKEAQEVGAWLFGI